MALVTIGTIYTDLNIGSIRGKPIDMDPLVYIFMLYLLVSLVFYAGLSFGPTTWGLFGQNETLRSSPHKVLLSHLYHFKAYATLIDQEKV
jgi:hypothetical protein